MHFLNSLKQRCGCIWKWPFFFSHQALTSINYGIVFFSQAPTGEVAEDDGEHGNYLHMY